MSTSLLVFIELVLIFGLVFGLAGWELWKLRRDRRRESDAGQDRHRGDA